MKKRINQCFDNLKLFLRKLSKKKAAAFIFFYIALIAGILLLPERLHKFDNFFYDLAQRNVTRWLQPSDELAIVAIDTETLEGVKQRWPWSRTTFAELISAIDAHKPAAILLDIVFSIDSIITAVGMTDDIPIMVIAVCVAVFVMLVAATPLASISRCTLA